MARPTIGFERAEFNSQRGTERNVEAKQLKRENKQLRAANLQAAELAKPVPAHLSPLKERLGEGRVELGRRGSSQIRR